jgi:hypothetical protein
VSALVTWSNPPKEWSKLCRQLTIGYGPCYLPRGHRGDCHSLHGTVAQFPHKTRRVAVDARGKLCSGDFYGYRIERPRASAAVAEARRLLAVADGEAEKLAARRKQLRGLIRAGGVCEVFPE